MSIPKRDFTMLNKTTSISKSLRLLSICMSIFVCCPTHPPTITLFVERKLESELINLMVFHQTSKLDLLPIGSRCRSHNINKK